MTAKLPRILVIDDNALNVELVVYVLTAASAHVDVARNAQEALVRIEESRPDVILMDIQMPGLNGLELTRLIKTDPRYRDIVVIAFTAYSMKGDDLKMRSAGCDGYITKPIDIATFSHQVFSHYDPGRVGTPS